MYLADIILEKEASYKKTQTIGSHLSDIQGQGK